MNDFSSHDGLHDSLTGALTLQAFYEAVEREIARAGRDSINLHLLLLKLPPPVKTNSIENELTNSSKNPNDLKKRVLEIAENFSAELAIVEYQENWKLAEFLLAGDVELQKMVTAKKDGTT